MEEERERLRRYIGQGHKLVQVAHDIGCTDTHLRRYMKYGQRISADLVDQIRDYLDRKEKRVTPLTDKELEDLRRLLPLLLELEPELSRLSESTFHPTVERGDTRAQHHRQSSREPSASTPPAASPSAQSE
jgi:hypothetical protein